jgi:hypothetical protein
MRLRAITATLLLCGTASAADITWSGESGSWQEPGRWSGGAVPGAGAGAVLDNVATGTRTVTNDAPASIGRLVMTQAGDGTNALVLNADLTIAPPNDLVLTRTGGALAIDLKAGRTLLIEGEHLRSIAFPGTLTMGRESLLELSFSAPQGGAELINSGTLVQDGGKILFHWRPPTALNSAARRFINSKGANWTLTGGAAIDWRMDAGRNGGFGNMYGSRNEGTMRIEGDSTVAAGCLDNSGTLILDQARIGGGIGDGFIRNTGVIRVLGDTFIGHETYEPGREMARIENGVEGSTGATLEIGDGAKPVALTLKNLGSSIKNDPGNKVTVAPGAVVTIATSPDTAPHPNEPRKATIINFGEWEQSGVLRFSPNAAPSGTIGVINKGTFTVRGDKAVIERLPSARSAWYNETNQSGFGNYTDSVLTGDGTLTYRNSTGNAAVDVLALTSSGTIRPGTQEKVGALTLANTDVRFSDAGSGTLAIRIAGPDREACDRLVLSGEHGGTFALNEEGSTLDVTLAKGFTPKAAGSWRIVTAKKVTGAFLTTNLPRGFSVANDATGVVLSFKP